MNGFRMCFHAFILSFSMHLGLLIGIKINAHNSIGIHKKL